MTLGELWKGLENYPDKIIFNGTKIEDSDEMDKFVNNFSSDELFEWTLNLYTRTLYILI